MELHLLALAFLAYSSMKGLGPQMVKSCQEVPAVFYIEVFFNSSDRLFVIIYSFCFEE